MARSYGGYQTLSVGSDPKTIKSIEMGYLTGVQYFAAGDDSGFEVCAHRSPGCTDACLFKGGRGKMPSVLKSRYNKTRLFFEDRNEYWLRLISDFSRATMHARKDNLTPVFRLNGMSDIPWERVPVKVEGKILADNIFELYPEFQFYDYTKWPIEQRANLPKNYHLTFSLSETNDAAARRALDLGTNVAVVFSVQDKEDLPDQYWGMPVVSGDEHDLRFLDPSPCVVGLVAKGVARKDTSGFARGVPFNESDLTQTIEILQPA